MKSRIGFLFLIVLLFSACAKEKGNFHFSGRITDRETHQPVSNAFVSVNEWYHNGKECLVQYGKVYTNTNGEYDFTFDYFYKGEQSTDMDIQHANVVDRFFHLHGVNDGENHYDLEVETKSKLAVRIINQSPVDLNDSIFDIYIARPFGRQYVIEGNPGFSGTSVSRSDTTSFFGFSTQTIHYSYRKNTIVHQDSVTVTVADPYATTVEHATISY